MVFVAWGFIIGIALLCFEAVHRMQKRIGEFIGRLETIGRWTEARDRETTDFMNAMRGDVDALKADVESLRRKAPDAELTALRTRLDYLGATVKDNRVLADDGLRNVRQWLAGKADKAIGRV